MWEGIHDLPIMHSLYALSTKKEYKPPHKGAHRNERPCNLWNHV